MRICITGSVATDHLMTFPGRFSDSLVLAVWGSVTSASWGCGRCGCVDPPSPGIIDKGSSGLLSDR